MIRQASLILLLVLPFAGCNSNEVLVPIGHVPAAPRALAVAYYAGSVTVEWELAPDWDGEAFRVYSRRVTDASYFLVAEVTNCSDGLCSYLDSNVTAGNSYEYYVAAVDATSGTETATPSSVQIFVPARTPPPDPDAPFVIALDGANFITWGTASRGASDFSHYRVYQDAGSTSYLLGETDSEGFLDLLAANGETYAYFVTAIDLDGHESDGSVSAEGTPRPDFHGEWLYDHFADPTVSGFRFVTDESELPIVAGTHASRNFRLETDANGWWLVPNVGTLTSVYPTGFATTDIKCGVGADSNCSDVTVAPTSGYTSSDVELIPQTSYVLRVGSGASAHYGVIRVIFQGTDQNGDPMMIFDWAYQLQAGNRNLVSPIGG